MEAVMSGGVAVLAKRGDDDVCDVNDGRLRSYNASFTPQGVASFSSIKKKTLISHPFVFLVTDVLAAVWK